MKSVVTYLPFLAVLLTGLCGAEKQVASKGRKEAPPFLLETSPTTHHPSTHTPMNITLALPGAKSHYQRPSPPKPSPHLKTTTPPEDEEERMPYFFIFRIPHLTPEQDPDYGWSMWGDWSLCNTRCGVQSRHFRARNCEKPGVGACKGESIQWEPCPVISCPAPVTVRLTTWRPVVPVTKETESKTEEVRNYSRDFMEVGLDVIHSAVNSGPWDVETEHEDNGKSIPKVEDKVELIADEEVDDDDVELGRWHRCSTPCPFEIQLRQRWCYLGQYCIGDHKEVRVCSKRYSLQACGSVNVTNMEPEKEKPSSYEKPWVDSRIGWSSWTEWTLCADDCYHLQLLNVSRRCPKGRSSDKGCNEERLEDLRLCHEGHELKTPSSLMCASVEPLSSWKLVEDLRSRKKGLSSYNSHILHIVVILVLLAPLVVLFIYWVATKSRRPRYEPLPSSANMAGSLHPNPQSTISGDASSAVGPSPVPLDGHETWKTI